MEDWATFMNVRPGSRIVVNGENLSVDEVVTYRRIDSVKSDEMWVNLMTRIGGREVAVEAVRGEDDLTIWRRVRKFPGLTSNPAADLRYKREIYSLEEKGETKAIVETAEATETSLVPYWVLLAKSGRRVVVEIWDDQPYCYTAEATPLQVSF